MTAPEQPTPEEAIELRVAFLRAKLKAGWRSGSTSDDGDALLAELEELTTVRAAQRAAEAVEALGRAPRAQLIAALRSYQQADEDGIMVLVSRQACDEAAAILSLSECEPPTPPPGDAGRKCTCHPDDNPPTPCPEKFAYSECVQVPPGDVGERAREIVDEWEQYYPLDSAAPRKALSRDIAAALQSERTAAAQEIASLREDVRRHFNNAADLKERLDAAASQARRETWQPIDTAPKDGTRLLTWQPSEASPQEAILQWDAERRLWIDDRGSWFVIAPTHWQSLPEPPRPLATPQESAS